MYHTKVMKLNQERKQSNAKKVVIPKPRKGNNKPKNANRTGTKV